MVFLKEFFNKFILEKKVTRWQQKHEKLPSMNMVTKYLIFQRSLLDYSLKYNVY